MPLPFLTIPLLAFIACVVLHIGALKLFPKLNLLDFPERYGLRRKRLPYPTGIIPLLLFLLFFLSLEGWNIQAIGVSISVVLLGIFSFLDDRLPLSAWVRLIIQVLVAITIFATGSRIYTITNPLEGLLGMSEILKLDSIVLSTDHLPLVTILGPLPLLSGLFTILWLGLTMNALNWFDGIPGQVSTLSSVGFLTIGFLSMGERVQQPQLALMSFVLAALSLGCLLFDFPPPRVLMGDTGSMFFGLMLGVLTIYAGGKVATAFLVLGVPLIDSFLVVIQRILKGKNPLKGSLHGEHLHHRLLARGWAPRQVILLTASIGSLFGITALFLSTIEKFIAAVILFAIMTGFLFYTRKSYGSNT